MGSIFSPKMASPLLSSSSSTAFPYKAMYMQFKSLQTSSKSPLIRFILRHYHTRNLSCSFINNPPHGRNLCAAAERETDYLEWEDEDDDEGSPWEGAIVYKRSSSISHLEYCTTLERLGLRKVSTGFSRQRASAMGLRVTKGAEKDEEGTPVLVSVDVIKKKSKVRLDGIIRTVITLGCNRCGQPAAERIFLNFSLLLSEKPIREEVEEGINMGTFYGEEKFRAFGEVEENGETDESGIDLDDQLYFPPGEKAIDISKQIRDRVHLEIAFGAVCDPGCKGLCLRCGTNLNVGTCSCAKRREEERGYGPLSSSLRKQMQQKWQN